MILTEEGHGVGSAGQRHVPVTAAGHGQEIGMDDTDEECVTVQMKISKSHREKNHQMEEN